MKIARLFGSGGREKDLICLPSPSWPHQTAVAVNHLSTNITSSSVIFILNQDRVREEQRPALGARWPGLEFQPCSLLAGWSQKNHFCSISALSSVDRGFQGDPAGSWLEKGRAWYQRWGIALTYYVTVVSFIRRELSSQQNSGGLWCNLTTVCFRLPPPGTVGRSVWCLSIAGSQDLEES